MTKRLIPWCSVLVIGPGLLASERASAQPVAPPLAPAAPYSSAPPAINPQTHTSPPGYADPRFAQQNYPYPYPYAYPPPPYPPTVVAPPASPPRQHTITVNPLALSLGSFGVEFEKAVSSGLSLFAGPSAAYGSAHSGTESTRMYGAGGTFGLRAFFSDQAPKGGWFSPEGTAVYLWGDFSAGERVSATGYSLAGLFGYTWIFDSGFVLSLGGGLQYVNMRLESSGGPTPIAVGVEGILPALRLSLGFAF